ncbi:MAG: hypothetical protein Q8878_05895 [Bacillota bacterium]|nr:hypothetical protein [Bacillota bacterium]
MKNGIALFMITAFLFSASGCEKELTPSQTIEAAFGAVKTLDREAATEYIDYDKLMDYSEGDDLSPNDEAAGLLVNNLSIKIVSEERNAENAKVTAEITNLYLKPVFDEYVKEAVKLVLNNVSNSQDSLKVQNEMQELFISLLKKAGQKTTAKVQISLEKKKGGWMIEYDDALQDAVFGGLPSEIRSLVKQGEVYVGS